MEKANDGGKTAIITGGSSGIGRATASLFARNGFRGLALAARDARELQNAAHEVTYPGCDVLALPTDVTREDQVQTLVRQALERWGRIDVLVANAGQYIRAPISRLAVEDLEHSMAVNFYGAIYAILAVLPVMQAQHSGHIVLVSSLDAKKGLPPDAPYVAAKFAVSGFVEVLRQEMRSSGISVTTVYPGRVDTPMVSSLRFPRISPKMPPERVSAAILSALHHHPAEVIVPTQGKFLYWINVISPFLADQAVRLLHLEGWENQGG